MFSERAFTLIEAIVAILIALLIVVGLGGLTERLLHHRTTTDSNSAAMSLAERQMETLLADPVKSPPNTCTAASADLCGGAPPNGLTHGPTNINESGVTSASGPFRIQWVVIDANTTSQSFLVRPSSNIELKKITVTVTHLRNPNVRASVTSYYKAS